MKQAKRFVCTHCTRWSIIYTQIHVHVYNCIWERYKNVTFTLTDLSGKVFYLYMYIYTPYICCKTDTRRFHIDDYPVFKLQKTWRLHDSLTGDYTEYLLKFIDPSNLPACYGGSLRDPDGDPTCKTMVSSFYAAGWSKILGFDHWS